MTHPPTARLRAAEGEGETGPAEAAPPSDVGVPSAPLSLPRGSPPRAREASAPRRPSPRVRPGSGSRARPPATPSEPPLRGTFLLSRPLDSRSPAVSTEAEAPPVPHAASRSPESPGS
ncbi:lysine-rich arabinogalactan protein 19-like isoform X1 [Choloepus didactylus]|uniref:lysine-rich arabinogalactan protein 19-like isoform X1 n=1 Tax=Choloepus didactylus TaxID=27675 RepID=UPI00189C9D0A|nr:lysine-rich arabinogalactan protein 19-like isoform X1 [Choloepus didactylus]